MLDRIGGSHEGLPPGTVCSAGGDSSSADDYRRARLRIARTLVPGTIYEFSVQVKPPRWGSLGIRISIE